MHGERRGDGLAPPAGLLVGLAAGLAVLLTLGDPGLTVDEPLDVRPGRTYVATLRSQGWRFFDRDVVERVFRDNAEHPPLGRWLLGLASTLGEPFEILLAWGRPDRALRALGPARPGAGLRGPGRRWCVRSGQPLGRRRRARRRLVAPGDARVFAHAHLAALDTFLSLFWTLRSCSRRPGPGVRRPLDRRVIGAGALWSLALLTKIHAWLLLPILAVWAPRGFAWRRAASALCALGGDRGRRSSSGLALALVRHLGRWRAYWGTSRRRGRRSMVEYFGQVYADRDVPWHYPWFYFAVTVPVGLQLLGVLGLVAGWRRPPADRLPRAAGRLDRPVPGRSSAPGFRSTTASGCSCTSSRLGDADRAGLRPALGTLGHRARPDACCWRPSCWRRATARRTPPVRAELLQSPGRRTARGRAAGPGADLLERRGRSGLARPTGGRGNARGRSAALAPTLYPGQGILTTTAATGPTRGDPPGRRRPPPGPSGWSLSRRRLLEPELVARLRRGEGRPVVDPEPPGGLALGTLAFPRGRRIRTDPPSLAPTECRPSSWKLGPYSL